MASHHLVNHVQASSPVPKSHFFSSLPWTPPYKPLAKVKLTAHCPELPAFPTSHLSRLFPLPGYTLFKVYPITTFLSQQTITFMPSTMLGTRNNDMKLCGLYPWRHLRLEGRADNKPQQSISAISEIRTKCGPVSQAQDLSLFWSVTTHESFKAMKSLLRYFLIQVILPPLLHTYYVCVWGVRKPVSRWRSGSQLHMCKT